MITFNAWFQKYINPAIWVTWFARTGAYWSCVLSSHIRVFVNENGVSRSLLRRRRGRELRLPHCNVCLRRYWRIAPHCRIIFCRVQYEVIEQSQHYTCSGQNGRDSKNPRFQNVALVVTEIVAFFTASVIQRSTGEQQEECYDERKPAEEIKLMVQRRKYLVAQSLKLEFSHKHESTMEEYTVQGKSLFIRFQERNLRYRSFF